jgi:hypothetical protein
LDRFTFSSSTYNLKKDDKQNYQFEPFASSKKARNDKTSPCKSGAFRFLAGRQSTVKIFFSVFSPRPGPEGATFFRYGGLKRDRKFPASAAWQPGYLRDVETPKKRDPRLSVPASPQVWL